MSVKYIPDGYSTVTPYLIVKGAAAAIEFYKKALGATELFRMEPDEHGRIGHAEIRIGNSPIMLADKFPERDILSPQSIGGTPGSLYLYVEDIDRSRSLPFAAGKSRDAQPCVPRSWKHNLGIRRSWAVRTYVRSGVKREHAG